MRTFCKVALALGLAALLAGPALAKAKHHHRGFGAYLLLNKSVQQDLKMDQGQIDKVSAALKKVRDEYKGDIAKLRDRKVPREERIALAGKIARESRKAVSGILRPEQSKRFGQIRVQMAGVYAFLSPKVQKALQVTDSQKAQFKAIATSYREGRQALIKSAGGKRSEVFGKVAALRTEKMAAAMKVLTVEQTKIWTEMTGAPFHFVFNPPHKAA